MASNPWNLKKKAYRKEIRGTGAVDAWNGLPPETKKLEMAPAFKRSLNKKSTLEQGGREARRQ